MGSERELDFGWIKINKHVLTCEELGLDRGGKKVKRSKVKYLRPRL